MKKFITLFITLVLVITSLSCALVACNSDDDVELVLVSETEAKELIKEFRSNTLNADSYRITRDCRDSHNGEGFDYIVMRVNYNDVDVEMAYGVVTSFDNDNSTSSSKTYLLGDYYTSNNQFAHNEMAFYEKKGNTFELAKNEDEEVYGFKTIDDTQILYSIDMYLNNYFEDYSGIIINMHKKEKNGKLLSYEVEISYTAELVAKFTTVEFNGKQCLSEFTCTMTTYSVSDPTIDKYTFNYGEKFDIPVVG